MFAFSGLWRNGGFLKLWAGQTVSLFGSEITLLALPLTAILTLHAAPVQLGFIVAAERTAFILFSLFAGVWVDRLRRRPIMIAADLGRAVLLGTIPLAATLHALRIEQLYVVAFLSGILTLFFDVAYTAYLPVLVRREDIGEGNGKLEVSQSVAQIAGPGVAGVLVATITAPFAIALDALSFLGSVALLTFINTPEPQLAVAPDHPSIRGEIGEGLRLVMGQPLLRTIAGTTALILFFANMFQAVSVLYLTRTLGLGPALVGVIFAVGSIGGLLGALLTAPLTRRIGYGPAIIGGVMTLCVGALAFAAAQGPPAGVAPLLAFAWFLVAVGNVVNNINQVSVRQAMVPDRLQGRVSATMRFLAGGLVPLVGALLGGALGNAIGPRLTVVIASIGMLVPVTWVLLSPLRAVREQPPCLEA